LWQITQLHPSVFLTELFGKVTVKIEPTPEILVDAIIWSADSKDQDFRDDKWYSNNITLNDKTEIAVEIKIPESGFRAFYIDLKYKAPYGDDFTQSTRMFVTDNHKLLLRNN